MEPQVNSKILKKLNKTVSSFDEKFEGSIFYLDGDKKRDTLYPMFKQKRIDFAEYATENLLMVEVGVNAGHSALLALSSNNSLTYIGIDILHHQYTLPCVKVLQKHFPNRIHFQAGDSRDVLPNIYDMYPGIKNQPITWVIDGGHDPEVANIDIQNVINLAGNKDILIFDDIEQEPLHALIEKYISKKKLNTIKKTNFHWILEIDKDK